MELKRRNINNVKLFACSGDMHSNWDNAPPEITFIVDLDSGFARYFEEQKIDLFLASFSLNFFLGNEKVISDRRVILRFFTLLKNVFSKSSELRMFPSVSHFSKFGYCEAFFKKLGFKHEQIPGRDQTNIDRFTLL